MAKVKRSDSPALLLPEHDPLTGSVLRRRRSLILRQYLREEARKEHYRGADEDRARGILQHWAELAAKGHLREKKERAIDADFLLEVFGKALGYKPSSESPEEYHLEREFTIPGTGTADGALGIFRPNTAPRVVAVIELKDARTDLDRDKFNGRTPVQQCWDYLDALPDCPWGIVSNFVEFRLYHRNKTPQAFEYFRLEDLRNVDRFREFYCLFERGGLLRSTLGQPPRAMRLLEQTGERQRKVGDELYLDYSENRLSLIDHLLAKQGKDLETAIHVAQKILDRIIFIAFCEDRGLLPPKVIEDAHRNVPPFAKVTNPRWQNFLGLFRGVDVGHEDLHLEGGYDGGLFRHDAEVDDLQLDDEWTDFFRNVGRYDFRDEVNVDVLGHLFEKSVTELERLRLGGLFAPSDRSEPSPSAMPKSAQRKRLGIYYTPVAFTSYIVEQALGKLVEARSAALAESLGVRPTDGAADDDPAKLEAYWRGRLGLLRDLKVCDAACGSGAFLIQAYDFLEECYGETLRHLAEYDEASARETAEEVPDIILRDNLFGVDLSPEAIEITQLALWIRSARRGETLADLSRNVVCGNSLVTDREVDPRAMDWPATFPAVFERDESGFDCVVGNPPWERLKLQEREFFAFSAPAIATAVSAAKRRAMIAELAEAKPELFARYERAKSAAEQILAHVRGAGQFPLTAKGDINTYVLFAELGHRIVAPRGRVGLLVPSGIATDKTTKDFFGTLMEAHSLLGLFDFENKKALFPDVHRSFKFCVLLFGGRAVRTEAADFVFFARRMEDLEDRDRHIRLSVDDLARLNPNTHTCPIFRSRRDAELTQAIYDRVPILVEKSRGDNGNPWGLRFFTMFHQTNDAELFHAAEKLAKMGFKQKGNRWAKGKQVFLPLYEAKMVQAYDHRAASVVIEDENWVRQGQTVESSLVSHQKPDFVVQPRWWVAAQTVAEALHDQVPPALLCYKDVTSPTNQRTMIAAFVPPVGLVNSAPVMLTGDTIAPRLSCCLLANLDSFALDYVARQKVGNVHLNFFIVEQFPILAPDAYDDKCPWDRRQTLERWISDRVLRLSCTAQDMIPLAEACGFTPGIRKWKPAERATWMAELDAAYFLLYGVGRDDVAYILSTFSVTRREEQADLGPAGAERLILDAYDRLAVG